MSQLATSAQSFGVPNVHNWILCTTSGLALGAAASSGLKWIQELYCQSQGFFVFFLEPLNKFKIVLKLLVFSQIIHRSYFGNSHPLKLACRILKVWIHILLFQLGLEFLCLQGHRAREEHVHNPTMAAPVYFVIF